MKWEQVRGAVRNRVPDSTWQTWLEPVELALVDGPVVVVSAPAYAWTVVRDRYAPFLLAAVREAFGAAAEVDVVEAGALASECVA